MFYFYLFFTYSYHYVVDRIIMRLQLLLFHKCDITTVVIS